MGKGSSPGWAIRAPLPVSMAATPMRPPKSDSISSSRSGVSECADRRAWPAAKARPHAPLKINVRRDQFRALSIDEPSLPVGVVGGPHQRSSYGRGHFRKILELVNALKPRFYRDQ